MLVLGLLGCEMPPRFVQSSSEVDTFVLQKKYRSACVGLDATEDSLREYTAEKLVELSHVKVVNECLCEALYDGERHEVDFAVAAGVAHSERDDLAACLAPALEDAAIDDEERARVVVALGALEASGAYAAIRGLLSHDSPSVRAGAAAGLARSREAQDALLEAATSDEAPVVRAAAALALEGRKADSVRVGLSKLAREDADASVRAAALTTAAGLETSPTMDRMICDAMMSDDDEQVRLAAVKIWHGSKRLPALRCFDDRMSTEESSGAVRQAVLDAVAASPNKEAAAMLCRHINPWARMYIKDKVAPDIEGHDIAGAQNDRDFEKSYDCVKSALGRGGLSCYARNYLGKWMNDLGGKAPTPWCPGMARN
jgi:hypothetical protein